MQWSQVIERNIHEIISNLLNPPRFFQENRGLNLEKILDERRELFFLDLSLETENENPKVSIQEGYHPLHAALEGNFNLSCVQFESDDHNEVKDEFEEPPLDVYKDFIQYNHDKYFAADPQISQLAYTKPQKECLHWINRSNHHFILDFLW